MTPPHCSSKKTKVPEVVETLTLVIIRSRSGEPRPSSDFREFISLNFLSFVAILGIEFPWSLHLANFQRRVWRGWDSTRLSGQPAMVSR